MFPYLIYLEGLKNSIEKYYLYNNPHEYSSSIQRPYNVLLPTLSGLALIARYQSCLVELTVELEPLPAYSPLRPGHGAKSTTTELPAGVDHEVSPEPLSF